MKTGVLIKTAAMLAAVTLAGAGSIGRAVVPPDAAPTTPPAPTATNASAPPLAFGVPQILKLAQGKVSDETIIAYIKNSRTSYNLDADQILWLRQQGVSDAVITAMLNQPKPGMGSGQPAMTMPQAGAAPAYPPAAYGPPPSQYPPVDTADYGQPDYYYPSQPYSYYYPNYYYPPVFYYYGGVGYRGYGFNGYHYRNYGWHGGYGAGVGHIGGTVGHRSFGGGARIGGGAVGHRR